MKSIKIKSSAERADELLRDPAAYFASVRAEVQRDVERTAGSRNPEPFKKRRRRVRIYRYLAGDLAPGEHPQPSRPRLETSGHLLLSWKVGRWVYCLRVVKS